jgi:hypothetical protein
MKHDPSESAAKLALDDAELILRVPALRREVARYETVQVGAMFGIVHNRDPLSYEIMFQLPDHPLVAEYVNEQVNAPRRSSDNLKTARRHLRAAYLNYEKFSLRRGDSGIRVTPEDELGRYADFARDVSLSSIIEAKAEAEHWFKIAMRLEREKPLTLRQQFEKAWSQYEFWRNPIRAAPRPPDVLDEREMCSLALENWHAIRVQIAKENRAKRKAKWTKQQKRRQQLRSMGLMS